MDVKITDLFNRGFSYKEIVFLLESELGVIIRSHPVLFSCRHLKRQLKRLNLKRRGVWNVDDIQIAIQDELGGSGRNLGCRSMAQRLRIRHGMSVGRNTVLNQLRLLDPEGVSSRRSHRLIRRTYRSKGPNYLIHTDGYDKIKQYGFAIHGAIDGYSRRVLWLKVNRTNNDPFVVASYFLEFVKEVEGTPRCIRMDAGTENGVIANMQKSFRWFHGDEMAGEKSVIIGTSPSNQRIECWWRRLHEMCIAVWQQILGDLEIRGIFSTANTLHLDCVRFCFTQIIQRELDMVKQEWNDHEIRRQNGNEVHGKPHILYHHPELYGQRDYLFPVEMDDVEAFFSFCKVPTLTGCEQPVQSRLFALLDSTGRNVPETIDEAIDLLQWLITYLD